MRDHSDPLETDRQFFLCLIDADLEALNRLLTDDFLLIDVISGSEIGKRALFSAMESGQLRFTAIELLEAKVRRHHSTAIVTGRTQLSGRFGDSQLDAHSRYTHVYIEQHGHWRLIAAQGTKVLE